MMAVVLIAALAYLGVAVLRSVPAPAVVGVRLSASFSGSRFTLNWPRQGEAALAVDNVGLVGFHGAERPVPIASVAKVMTAFVVLSDHPLHGTQSGPELTITPADVGVYRLDAAAGDSVVAVRAGERLSERQALEGLLLPSGNNIAFLLAQWDAGSQTAFVAKMNQRAKALGLDHTHYADASGVAPATASTAADQTQLALAAVRVPVFRQIVAMPQATLPVAGTVFNVDAMLGRDGIVGVKTGTTTQAGGCFVFAALDRVDGRTTTLVGAVLHQLPSTAQPSIISAAFHATASLLSTARSVPRRQRVLAAGSTIAVIQSPWTAPVALRVSRSVSLLGWPGLKVQVRLEAPRSLPSKLTAGERLGSAIVTAGYERATVPVVLSQTLPGPSLGWRLSHP